VSIDEPGSSSDWGVRLGSTSQSSNDSAIEPGTGEAASTRVAAYLRDLILRDVLKPGDRIRQEEIADRLGASRLPVREALRMLEAEGLTEHEPNKGARVPQLSMHEIDVIYRMRERLEPVALAESLQQLDSRDFAKLEDIQHQIEQNTDLDDFLELDRAFHLTTYSGCHIDPLNAIVTRLWNSTQHYRRAYVALGGERRMWVVNSEHRLLLDAITRHDSPDAERFLEGHIRRTRVELGKHPSVFEPKNSRPPRLRPPLDQ
jgi:DNA-binding GntR family transcriptional regulator